MARARRLRVLAAGLVAASIGLAACSGGSSADANHRTCAQVQQADRSYNKRDYAAWRAHLAQAAQIASSASDAQLRRLAQRAADLTNLSTTTTVPTTAVNGFHFNAGFAAAGAYVALRDHCQANYA